MLLMFDHIYNTMYWYLPFQFLYLWLMIFVHSHEHSVDHCTDLNQIWRAHFFFSSDAILKPISPCIMTSGSTVGRYICFFISLAELINP